MVSIRGLIAIFADVEGNHDGINYKLHLRNNRRLINGVAVNVGN
jgi:hypothetical protein